MIFMKKIFPLALIACMVLLAGCFDNAADGDHGAIDKSVNAKGDSTLYGLTCDGSSDSSIVFLPNSGGDPDTFNILPAIKNNKVFGSPTTGDWVGLMLNPKNKREALMVIDLDQLKGTWTYEVTPVLKKSNTMTTAQMEAQIPDSIRSLVFIPREYGFTLKRHSKAQGVGFVMQTGNALAESLVEYPPVPHYTKWSIFNGRLVLMHDTLDARMKRIPDSKVKRTVADFVFLKDDTMALRINSHIVGFHRQVNGFTANAKAQKAANKIAAADTVK